MHPMRLVGPTLAAFLAAAALPHSAHAQSSAAELLAAVRIGTPVATPSELAPLQIDFRDGKYLEISAPAGPADPDGYLVDVSVTQDPRPGAAANTAPARVVAIPGTRGRRFRFDVGAPGADESTRPVLLRLVYRVAPNL